MWKPGKQQVISDTLSRVVNPKSCNDGEDMIEKLTTCLSMRPEKLKQLKQEPRQYPIQLTGRDNYNRLARVQENYEYFTYTI